MSEYTITGIIIGALISLGGFYLKIKADIQRDYKEKQEPINKLNVSITELTAEIRHMREDDEIANKRIEKHGKEIDELKDRAVERDKKLMNHESRINALEKK